MILVADSGSTKCDWLLQTQNPEPEYFHTMGFNPMFHTAEFIRDEILKNRDLVSGSQDVSAVYYYGASVSSPDRIEIVKRALSSIFTHAEIHAEHDLTGAVRATCGNEPGIACILGTGSNSCYFNGRDMDDHIPALGYVLGDEAGGAWFGRELIRRYLYKALPSDVNTFLEKEGLTKEVIFDKVYRHDNANVFLASLMPVLGTFRDRVEIRQILEAGFEEFIKYHVLCYEEYKHLPVHFVGSVGLNFREILENVCSKHQIRPGVFTNEPVKNLFAYHLQNHK